MCAHFLGIGAAVSSLRPRPPIFFSAPAMPVVCRVNCTADASASYSRWRAIAALIRRPKNNADVADHEQRRCRPARCCRRIAAAATAAGIHQDSPDDGEHEDAEQHAHQADVQAHVAVEHVAELVRDHALQFVALELVEAAPRHGDRGIGGRVAGGERVDAGFVLEHVDFRHRHAGGDRHFLDHVAQALLRADCRCPPAPAWRRARAPPPPPPPERLAMRYSEHSADHRQHQTREIAERACRACGRRCAERDHADQIDRDTIASTASTNSTTSRRLLRRARACWAKKFIVRAGRRSAGVEVRKRTFGASRLAGSSISSGSAGETRR